MNRSSWQPAAGVGGWDFGDGRDTEEPQPGLLFAAEVEEFERRERKAVLACGCDTQQDVLCRRLLVAALPVLAIIGLMIFISCGLLLDCKATVSRSCLNVCRHSKASTINIPVV